MILTPEQIKERYEVYSRAGSDADVIMTAPDAAYLCSIALALEAEVRRLREALTRLGSMEAFECSMAVDRNNPFWIELEARIDYARAAALSKEAGYE